MALHFDNLQMVKEAVAHGAGISIIPKRIMREELLQGRIVALRLDPAELYRPVRIIHRRRKVFNEVSQAFLALLRRERAEELETAVRYALEPSGCRKYRTESQSAIYLTLLATDRQTHRTDASGEVGWYFSRFCCLPCWCAHATSHQH